MYQGTNDNKVQDVTEGTSVVVTGLSNGTTYSFWVSAVNSGGSVQSTTAATAMPAAPTMAPAAPTNLMAAAGANQVQLSWTAVTGAASYKVYQDGTALAAVITTPSHTVTGLTAGTSYSFMVSAVNSVGEGAQSSPAATATPLPPAVTGLMATAGSHQVVLTWTASADTAVTGYKIRTSGGIADVAVSGRTTTTGTVTGLTAGREYSFTIAAVAGSTESTQSDPVTAVPAPPVPTGFSASAGVEQVVLRWDTVTTRTITGYKVRQTVDGSETEINVILTSAHTVTGLTAGKSYTFTIAAVAGSAESAQSTATTAVIPTPAVPAGLSAAAGVAQVVLTWTASTNAGVTGYTIEQTVDSTTSEIDISGRATATHTVTGLTIGKSYSFKIKAVAGSVDSGYSSATSAVPTPPAVTDLAATAGIEQATLTWRASTTTGVTGYKIRQTVDGTTTEIDVTGMSTASHTVSSLTAGKSYSFTIAAVTASVESAPSDAVTAVPTPPAVTGLMATAGAEQATLTWTASSTTEVTGYKIRTTGSGGHSRCGCKRKSNCHRYGNRLERRAELQFHHSGSGRQHGKHRVCSNHCSNTNPCRTSGAECGGRS